jgi:DNA-binding IclR family transcriptional regulator
MKNYKVPALERAFRIVDMLAMSSMGLTKMEIATQLGIPYSTAFNLLNTMEECGYARKDEGSGKYFIGFKFLSLANAHQSDSQLRQVAAPLLERLVERTGLTAHLGILDRGEAIYIDKRESNGFFRINTWIGKRNYVHSSAIGKALIAERPMDEIDQAWEQGLPTRTPKTIRSVRKFKNELKSVRERGYAIDKEEDEIGGRCVAAPIRDASGEVIAAISVSGVASQLSDDRIAGLGALVCEACDQASRNFGYLGASRLAS